MASSSPSDASSSRPRSPSPLRSVLNREESERYRIFRRNADDEIGSVYRGICVDVGDSSINPWGRCVDEESCATLRAERERKSKAEQARRKRGRKKSNNGGVSNGASECRACDFNPQCLVSLGGVMNEVLARDRNINGCSSSSDDKEDPSPPSVEEQHAKSSKSLAAHVRKSISVSADEVRDYLRDVVGTSSSDCAGHVRSLREYHASLLLPPLEEEGRINTSDTDSTVELSLPPGMKNLGATCYLNSQIQCLARNVAFQTGVLCWRSTTGDDGGGINAALKHLQSLLANLEHTPHNIIDTTLFASSLNLLEGEMQDPNEFSRLLLDRMMDSCSGLKKLLCTIFEGQLRYETKCHSCGSARGREESFTELTLPIPNARSWASPTKKRSRASPGKAKTVVGLRDCLAAYLRSEEMSAENRYDCEVCRCKRDAVRNVSFTTLPPVLQIQLSRYGFDVERNVKRKRTDEVSLPHRLDVMSTDYVLCGVLHHMGTSAYGGHYFARAMDWTTGVWFEFNDKDVRVLDRDKVGAPDPDAYSMFYVERGYLRDQARRVVETRTRRDAKVSEIVESVKRERAEVYGGVSKAQRDNLIHLSKMEKRRQDILTKMFPPGTPLHFERDHHDLRWVNGTDLRRFLSLSRDPPSSSSGTSLCPHLTGLHPRDAREGKLLSREMFNAYARILADEGEVALRRRLFVGRDGSVVSPHSNLSCIRCAALYKNELQEKYRRLQALTALLEEFSGGGRDEDEDAEDEEESVDQSYAVSSRFVTDLKRYGVRRVKEILKDPSTHNEGLDCLSLEELDNAEAVVREGGEPVVDPFVNSRLTCPHGSWRPGVQGRSVRYVDEATWRRVTLLAPRAIVRREADEECEACLERAQRAATMREWATAATRARRRRTKRTTTSGELYLVRRSVTKCWREATSFYEKAAEGGAGEGLDGENKLEVFRMLKAMGSKDPAERSRWWRRCEGHGASFRLLPQLRRALNSYQQHLNNSVDGLLGSLGKDKDRIAAETRALFAAGLNSSVELLDKEDYLALVDSVSELTHLCPFTANRETSQIELHSTRITVRDHIALYPPACSHGCVVDHSDTVEAFDVDDESSSSPKGLDDDESDHDDDDDDDAPAPLEVCLNVYEIDDPSLTVESVAATEAAAVAASLVREPDDLGRVRRSTRKRKARFQTCYPVTLNLDDSLSKLRLKLHLEYCRSPFDQRLTLVVLHAPPTTFSSSSSDEDSAPPHTLVFLPASWNERTVREVLDDEAVLGGRPFQGRREGKNNNLDLAHASAWVYLTYDRHTGSMSRRERAEIEESLVRSLEETNASEETRTRSSTGSGRQRGSGGSNRRAERGFTGTLLQSSSTTTSTATAIAASKATATAPREPPPELPTGTASAVEGSTNEFRPSSRSSSSSSSSSDVDGVCLKQQQQQPNNITTPPTLPTTTTAAAEAGGSQDQPIFIDSDELDGDSKRTRDDDDESSYGQSDRKRRNVANPSLSSTQVVHPLEGDFDSEEVDVVVTEISTTCREDDECEKTYPISIATQETPPKKMNPVPVASQKTPLGSPPPSTTKENGSSSVVVNTDVKPETTNGTATCSNPNLHVFERKPTSKYDLSPAALAYTRPLHESPDAPVLPNNTFPLAGSVSLEAARYFLEGAAASHRELCALSDDDDHDVARSLALLNFRRFASGTVFSDDRARHLYRNFVDEPSPPALVRDGDRCATRVSRREADVLSFVERVEDAAELLSYRDARTLEAMAAAVRRRRDDDGPYAQRARRSVTTLLELERRRRRGTPNGTSRHG